MFYDEYTGYCRDHEGEPVDFKLGPDSVNQFNILGLFLFRWQQQSTMHQGWAAVHFWTALNFTVSISDGGGSPARGF